MTLHTKATGEELDGQDLSVIHSMNTRRICRAQTDRP